MYHISDGYNLEPKNETLIDKIIEINKGTGHRRLSHMITEALTGQSHGNSRMGYNQDTASERTIEQGHYSHMRRLNSIFRIAKNKNRILSNKGKTKDLN